MARSFKTLAVAAVAALFFSCNGGEEEVFETDAPAIVSVSPADGTEGVKGTTLKVVFTYDQNIKCPLDKQSTITVDNDAIVSSVTAYSTDLTISLEGLQKGITYTVRIPEAAVLGFKVNQKASPAASLSFSTEEPEPEAVDYELNPVTSLTNPNATAQAKKVYSYLLEMSGNKTLTGVQSEGTANNNEHIDLIYSKTGKHPALAGYDFIFLQYSPTPASSSWKVDYGDMSAPIAHWNAGGLVSYMWHWNVPNSELAWENGVKNSDFSGYAFYSNSSSFDIKEALKDTTWQHEFLMKDLEKVAGYLKILQDAGVPVIWRPLHEAAGNYNLYGKKNNAWFWWGRGGAEACKSLYKLMRETFEDKYGLNNLIWVWTLDVNAAAQSEWQDWYPGDEYVDIVGTDIYADDTSSKKDWYQACVNLSKGNKLVAITECGNIPDPALCQSEGERWSWFMVWSSTNYALNTDTYWKKLMSESNTVAREAMPSLK